VSPYLALLLLSCVASSVLAAFVLGLKPRRRSSRDAGLILAGGAFWADGVLRMAAPLLRETAVVEKRYESLPLIARAPQELQHCSSIG
jgi:hypothetical protein